VDEVFGICAFLVDLAEIRIGKPGAQRAHRFADFRMAFGTLLHGCCLVNGMRPC
jgi:hypothetical protein